MGARSLCDNFLGNIFLLSSNFTPRSCIKAFSEGKSHISVLTRPYRSKVLTEIYPNMQNHIFRWQELELFKNIKSHLYPCLSAELSGVWGSRSPFVCLLVPGAFCRSLGSRGLFSVSVFQGP